MPKLVFVPYGRIGNMAKGWAENRQACLTYCQGKTRTRKRCQSGKASSKPVLMHCPVPETKRLGLMVDPIIARIGVAGALSPPARAKYARKHVSRRPGLRRLSVRASLGVPSTGCDSGWQLKYREIFAKDPNARDKWRWTVNTTSCKPLKHRGF